jgi:RNA recognition motif-containing protein
MARVYIDNLADAVTRDDLNAHFSRVGPVRGVLVVTDRSTGKSRGFGFVDMKHFDDAIHAIKMLNHTDLKGKRIRIDRLPPREKS